MTLFGIVTALVQMAHAVSRCADLDSKHVYLRIPFYVRNFYVRDFAQNRVPMEFGSDTMQVRYAHTHMKT